MTHEEYEKAMTYWNNKAEQIMPQEELTKEVLAYIQDNNTCALATGSEDFIRCTPIEYTYHHHAFWMFSEGGMKFKGLESNSHVCLAIFDRYENFGQLKGMQVMGKAELIVPFSKEYEEAAKIRYIPLEALKKLPSPMHLIRIQEEEIIFLNTDFKKKGYDSRQVLHPAQ